jgi:superfamily II DNA or RNA helicase
MYLGPFGHAIPLNILENEKGLCRELTVHAPRTFTGIPEPPLHCWRKSATKIYIPRFFGKSKYGPVDVRLPEPETIDVPFEGGIREVQRPAIDAFLASPDKCGLLQLPCGFGKTVIALNLVSVLKKKTLIVVHKAFLMDQWADRIKQFLPTAKVGRIQGPVVDIEGKDIVLGMLQSLSMKTYDPGTFACFGFIVVDETHHIAADVFCNFLFKAAALHMLGLSATMERKDGRTKVIKYFLGPVAYCAVREQSSNVHVHLAEFASDDLDYYAYGDNYAVMVRKICGFAPRTEFALTVLADLLKDPRNEMIMVLAQNLALLEYVDGAMRTREDVFGGITRGFYVGGMKQMALKATEECRVVLATFAMAEEALDIPKLTTLLLASPKGDVTQAVGRILRVPHERPLVVDIVDRVDVFRNQAAKRVAFYRKNGYTIETSAPGKYPEAIPLPAGRRKA